MKRYQAAAILDTTAAAVQAAVQQLEPDCVLLDGRGLLDYGESWETAAWLARRDQPVPTIMLTGHQHCADEARSTVTARSQAAAFAGVMLKPFDLDEVLAAVAQAMTRHPAPLMPAGMRAATTN